MPDTKSRLTNSQFDELVDQLEDTCRSASETTYMNYKCTAEENRKIGVMRAFDFPQLGVTTFVSFGVSHETFNRSGFPDRIELVQAFNQTSTEYERLLVVVADSIIMRGRVPRPGVIYENAAVIADLPDISSRMPHAMILFPYLWGEAFTKFVVGGLRIWFLQVVPIYDGEKQFIDKNGFIEFDKLLTAQGVFFHQIDRQSMLKI